MTVLRHASHVVDGKQYARQSFRGQGVGTGGQHQLAQLGFLPVLQRPSLILECLDLSIEIGGQTTKVELSKKQTTTVKTTDEKPAALGKKP